jgi:queuine/archaeosine tRNA-ribosyltransferase
MDDSAKIKHLSGLLKALPECYYATLRYLMAHLRRIADHANENLMTEHNLAVVFGPNLLRSADILTQEGELADMVSKNTVIEYMIKNEKLIFD